MIGHNSEQLIEAYLAGTIGSSDADRLLAELRTNSEVREDMAAQEDVDMLLRHLARTPVERNELTERIVNAIPEHAVCERLTDRVIEDIRYAAAGSRREKSRGRRTTWRGTWVPLAAAAALLVAGGVWWATRNAERGMRPDYSAEVLARVTEARGGVWGYGSMGVRELKEGDEVREGMRIETGEKGSVTFAYANEATRVSLEENAKLDVGGVQQGKRLHLELGRIAATVAKQPARKPFVVTTRHARATVKGTMFRLRTDDKATVLDVREGLIEFERLSDGRSLMVKAGEVAVAGANAEDFALKAYPADTAYVDGPVIFQDDFENGMGNWRVWIHGPTGSTSVVGANMGLFARIEAKPEGETRSNCLVLDSLPPARPVVGGQVMLTTTLPRLPAAFSVEYEMRALDARRSSAHAGLLIAQMARMDVVSPQERTVRTLDWRHWRTCRLEYEISGDTDGNRVVTEKRFLSGILLGMMRYYPDKDMNLREFILVGRGGLWGFDGIVVRELVKADAGSAVAAVQPGGER